MRRSDWEKAQGSGAVGRIIRQPKYCLRDTACIKVLRWDKYLGNET